MAIECRNLSYIYSEGSGFEIQALHQINLLIPDGEFVGLTGHTGSGKSTLIQHFNGLLRATAGDLLVDGESIYADGYSMRKLRSKVGLVFQYPEHQLFEATVLQDVMFGPKNLGLSAEEQKERALEALHLVGCPEKSYEKSPFELSGGQRRRVAIAGVLAMKPQVLILDEPTAGLDPRGRYEILDEIARLHKETGITVILVSHCMEDVAQYADRMIVMSHGSVVYHDTPAEVFKHRQHLEEMGLAVPQVTSLMQSLAEAGIPVRQDLITVSGAREELLRVFGGRSV
ncbi:MAG: energy-coupling factor transporter ATPase [Lachnospiraceae bacterium]|nr:energy-coupling factor transporter ATPase [Lachnospiraceae bacterium]MBR0153779.1 energy-coupling factor transporter ATPase [Lachnospiraceae bacterium]